MLSGIGLALVDVPRFKRALERHGERLVNRVFSPEEASYARRKRLGHQNFAARFAAKLAGRAAFLNATGRSLPLSAFEVRRRKSGEPLLVTRGSYETELRLRLSLSHDADFALASVWLETPSA